MTCIIEKDDIVPYYGLRKGGDDEGRRNGMKSPRAQVGTVVLLAVLAAGLLIALSQLSALRERAGTDLPVPAPAAGGTASESGATAQPAPAGLRQPTLGDPEAPVLIVEFAEFYCPYCAKFTWETFPKIEEDYIATGRVRYEFRNLVVHGEAALLAAVAGECAHDGGRFWSYLDRLFLEIFPGRNLYRRRELGVDDLVRLAGEVGLNPAEFAGCLEGYASHREGCREALDRCTREGGGEGGGGNALGCRERFYRCMSENPLYREIVEDRDNLDLWIERLPPEDRDKAGRIGTPTFFINGRILVGAQPYPVFRERIEAELARLRGEG